MSGNQGHSPVAGALVCISFSSSTEPSTRYSLGVLSRGVRGAGGRAVRAGPVLITPPDQSDEYDCE